MWAKIQLIFSEPIFYNATTVVNRTITCMYICVLQLEQVKSSLCTRGEVDMHLRKHFPFMLFTVVGIILTLIKINEIIIILKH